MARVAGPDCEVEADWPEQQTSIVRWKRLARGVDQYYEVEADWPGQWRWRVFAGIQGEGKGETGGCGEGLQV